MSLAKETLMDVAKSAGIFTGIAFAIGVLYNVGYFTALDLQMFPLLSYKDHLETLVFFVPIAIVPIFLCLGLRAKAARARQANIAAGGLAAGTLIAWLERDEIAGSPTLSALVVSVVALTSFLLVAYCAAVIVQKLLEPGALDTARVQAMVYAGLGVLVFVTLFGNVRGHLDARGTRFDAQVVLAGENGSKTEIRPARMVRAIDSGLLLVFQDAPSQLAYVRYESVRTIAEPLRP
jgi:hypothetical protein